MRTENFGAMEQIYYIYRRCVLFVIFARLNLMLNLSVSKTHFVNTVFNEYYTSDIDFLGNMHKNK